MIKREEDWRIRHLKEARHMLGNSDLLNKTGIGDEYDIGTNNEKGLMKE